MAVVAGGLTHLVAKVSRLNLLTASTALEADLVVGLSESHNLLSGENRLLACRTKRK
jgi:hypothetical protein